MSKEERVREDSPKAPNNTRDKQVSVRLSYEENRMLDDVLHEISGQNPKARGPDVLREALRMYWAYIMAPATLTASEKAYIDAGLKKAAGEQIVIEGTEERTPYQTKPEWTDPKDLLPAACAFCGLMMNKAENILISEDKRTCRCYCEKCGRITTIGIKPEKAPREPQVPILDKPLNEYIPVACQRCGNLISERSAFIFDKFQGGPGTATVQAICPLCRATTLVGKYPAGWRNPSEICADVLAAYPDTQPQKRAENGPREPARPADREQAPESPKRGARGRLWGPRKRGNAR